MKIWLQNFLLWNLIFTIVPIIEFAILNASQVSFNSRKKNIKTLVDELTALAAKSGQQDLPETILNDSRKLISRKARQKIVGGDFLQIEDFEINMKHMK
jgi:hypothetical protein